jgi:hypothetical protein
MGFAFIKYDNESDADKARGAENKKDMGGLQINIGKFISFIFSSFFELSRVEQRLFQIRSSLERQTTTP